MSALAAADLAHAQESAADRAHSDRDVERRESEALARLQRDLATGPGNQIVLQISDALHSLQPLLMDSALDNVWGDVRAFEHYDVICSLLHPFLRVRC